MKCKDWLWRGFVTGVIVCLMAWMASCSAQRTTERERVKLELPEAVAKAIADNHPEGQIDKVEVENDGGITLFDIEFRASGGEMEIAHDGTVIDIATIVEIKDIPKAAADAIREAATGGEIKELERSEVRAKIEKEGDVGKVVKLVSPRYVYEAELVKGNQEGEIEVDSDGKIIEPIKWGASGEKEKEKADKPREKK